MITAPQIFLNDELLDTDGKPLKLERANSLFEAEPIKGEYSYPFTWPLTARNRRLLNNPQEFGLLDEPLIYRVKYMSLGELVDGLLYVDNVTYDSNSDTGSIQGNLNGTEGILANAFGTKKLSAMPLGGSFPIPDSPVRHGIDPVSGSGGGNQSYKSRACEFATGVTNGSITGYGCVFPMIKWIDYRDRATYESFHAPGGSPDSQYYIKDSVIPLINDCVNYWTDNVAGIQVHGTGTGWDYPYATQCYPFLAYQPIYYLTTVAAYNAVNRIIPMFTLKWLLQKLFADVEFDLAGTILTDPSFEKLFIVNNYSINRWVFDLTATIQNYDTADTINPANHVPDMKVVDFLNQIFSWLGLIPKVKNGTVTLYTINEILAMDDVPVTSDRSPVVIKTLTDTYSMGMSMKYTWPKQLSSTDDSGAFRPVSDYETQFQDLIKALPTPVLYTEVANHASLPAPSPYNIDAICLVVNEQEFYQNSKGVWVKYGQNLVDHLEDNSTDRVINGSPLAMATINISEQYMDIYGTSTDNSWAVRLPVIKTKGAYHTDTYNAFLYYTHLIGSVTLNDIGKDKTASFPLTMLFYHGLMAIPIGAGLGATARIPFSSAFQLDPGGLSIGPWDLSLESTRSLFHHFFDQWNKTIKRLVKYTVMLYPKFSDSQTSDLHSPKSLLQNRMLPYKVTYYEPYDGTLSMDAYKVKDTDPVITTAITLAVILGLDLDSFSVYDFTGTMFNNGSGSYTLHIVYTDLGTGRTFAISAVTTGPLSLIKMVRAAELGHAVSIFLRDDTNRVNSNLVALTMPALALSGSISLSLASSGGNLQLAGTTISGGSGQYRLEIKDTSDNIVHFWDFVATTSGSISTTATLVFLGLTAGATYHFTMLDTHRLVSNNVTLTV